MSICPILCACPVDTRTRPVTRRYTDQSACVVTAFVHHQVCTRGNSLASTPPGMPGTHPQYFGWGDVNGNIPQYYYVLSDIADQYWLPSVRSASSRFHSAIRRHQFASVRQADSRLTRLVPHNLELALTPLHWAGVFGPPCVCRLMRVDRRTATK